MKKIKAVFFDFDGTIFNLATDWDEIREELKKLFKKYHLQSSFRPLFGEIVRLLEELDDKGLTKKEIQALEKRVTRIIDEGEERGVKEGKLLKGAPEILAALKEKKILTVIISRNSGNVIQKVVDQFDLPQPNLIIGREDVGLRNLKPNPLAGSMALKRLGLKKEEVLFVGDSLNDEEFAQNFGVKVILLKSLRLPNIPEKAELISNLSELKKKINP